MPVFIPNNICAGGAEGIPSSLEVSLHFPGFISDRICLSHLIPHVRQHWLPLLFSRCILRAATRCQALLSHASSHDTMITPATRATWATALALEPDLGPLTPCLILARTLCRIILGWGIWFPTSNSHATHQSALRGTHAPISASLVKEGGKTLRLAPSLSAVYLTRTHFPFLRRGSAPEMRPRRPHPRHAIPPPLFSHCC